MAAGISFGLPKAIKMNCLHFWNAKTFATQRFFSQKLRRVAALEPAKAVTFFSGLLFTCCIYSASARAETLNLGPFKPKLTVFGVSLDPLGVNVSADIVTSRDGAYAKGDIFLSFQADQIVDKLSALSDKLLPSNLQAGNCNFEIRSASSLSLTVISNTGDFHAKVHVIPGGCLLTEGDVSLGIRFAPTVVKSILSIKIARLDVGVPVEWKFVGFIANKDPERLISDELRKRAESFHLSMPPIEHVRAAFQGASLDLKANNLIIRIRSDAQIDQAIIMDVLNRSD
jgi:hypothetical protein